MFWTKALTPGGRAGRWCQRYHFSWCYWKPLHIQFSCWLYLSQVQVFQKLHSFSSYTPQKILCIRRNGQISSSVLQSWNSYAIRGAFFWLQRVKSTSARAFNRNLQQRDAH